MEGQRVALVSQAVKALRDRGGGCCVPPLICAYNRLNIPEPQLLPSLQGLLEIFYGIISMFSLVEIMVSPKVPLLTSLVLLTNLSLPQEFYLLLHTVGNRETKITWSKE